MNYQEQPYDIWNLKLTLASIKGNKTAFCHLIQTRKEPHWWNAEFNYTLMEHIIQIGFSYGHLWLIQYCISCIPAFKGSLVGGTHWTRLLLIAMGNGHIDVVEWFIKCIAISSPNVYNYFKNLPTYQFQLACYQGNLQKAVAVSNIQLNNQLNFITSNNNSAMRWAKKRKHGHVVYWLKNKMIELQPKASIKINTKKRDIVYKKELDVCFVCQETSVELETCCKHSFCNDCIQKWYITSANEEDQILGQCRCPTCRQEVNELFPVQLEIHKVVKSKKQKVKPETYYSYEF